MQVFSNKKKKFPTRKTFGTHLLDLSDLLQGSEDHMLMRSRGLRAALLILKQHSSKRSWRKFVAYSVVGVTAGCCSSSVTYSDALVTTPVSSTTVNISLMQDVHVDDCSVLYSISALLEWISNGVQSLLRCGMLWLHFLPPMIAAPLLVLPSEEVYDWWWVLFRYSICSAGPTFIKFAQWAAMRPDLFQKRICFELSKLQAGARAHSWNQTQAILRNVLGADWEKHLILKKTDLLGSGCAAQVYRGTLILPSAEAAKDGNEKHSASAQTKEVAIKILHPGIRELMQLDLNLMRSVAYSLECVGGFLLSFYRPPAHLHGDQDIAALSALEMYPLRCVSLSESVQEFAAFMQSQLDLTQEARALDRLRNNFSGPKWKDRVILPETVYLTEDYTVANQSTMSHTERVMLPSRDVLMETYHEGVSMIDIMKGASDKNSERSAHNKELAALGLDAILKMLFEDNFVHADLHAGNILVKYAPATHHSAAPALVLLDAGLTVELRPFDRQNFVSLFRAVIDNDGREVARLMMEYSPSRAVPTRPPSAVQPATLQLQGSAPAATAGSQVTSSPAEVQVTWENTVIRPEEYKAEMAALVSYVHAQGLSLGKVSVSDLLRKVLQLSYEHNVKLESRFVTVVVAIMLAEGMGRRLDSEVDIIARAKPFVRSAVLKMVLNNK